MNRLRLALALAALGAVAAAAHAAEPAHPAAILRVLVIDTYDPKAYRRELDTLLKLERTVVPEATARVWQARYAGTETGTLVVTAELPDLAALVKLEELKRTNTEFAASLKRIQAMRHVVSDSLYEEVGP